MVFTTQNQSIKKRKQMKKIFDNIFGLLLFLFIISIIVNIWIPEFPLIKTLATLLLLIIFDVICLMACNDED